MKLKLTIATIFIALVGCGNQPHLNTLILNKEGNGALKGQNAQSALEKYIEALRFNPFSPELHLNLGLSFEFLQQPDKALQSYQEAEKLAERFKKSELLFMARFNAAQLLGKGKKIDEALAYYQKALEVIPNSKEAKTNIELLTQQQQGQGGGDGQDQKDQNQKDQKDQKQDSKDNQQGKDPKDQKDPKDEKDKPGQHQTSPKYQPRPFSGKELSEGDVKKILGEIKQQEQKIRAEFNRKEVKEQPRDKDW